MKKLWLFLLVVPLWAALPVINSFTTSSQIVASGGSITLNCSVTGTTTDIELDNGAGSFATTNSSCGGGISKSPSKTTLYKLVAGNNTGSDGQVWAYQRIFVGAGTLPVNITNCSGAIQNSTSCVITFAVVGTYANPYTDMVCDASFTAPSGAVIKRTSYRDALIGIWKIGFRPLESGTYSWSGLCGANPSSGTPNYHTVSGTFTASPSTAGGFLMLYGGSAPFRLKTAGDGKAFYPIGLQGGWDISATGVWQAFLPMTHGAPNPDNIYPASATQWFSTYAAGGTNLWRSNGQTQTSWISAYCDANGQNFYSNNPNTALDAAIDSADTYGMKIQLAPFEDPSSRLPGFNFFSTLKTSGCFMNAWLEIIARYSDRVSIWELGNEIFPNEQYIKTMIAFLHSQDTYGHLITLNYPTPFTDISSEHLYYLDTINPTQVQTLDASMTADDNSLKASFPNRPVIMGEFGDRCPAPDADPPINERWRDMLWVSFFNRVGIIGWNSFHGDGTGCPASLTNIFVGTTQRAQQLVFANWSTGFDPLAVPVSVTLGNLGANTARVYALAGSAIVGVYITHANNHSSVVAGATATLNVPASSLVATWMNPFDGTILGTYTPSVGLQTFTIPAFSQDIVLKITSSGPTARRCDINGDGIVDVLDLQLSISSALGQSSCTADLDGNGRCDIVDIQRVINAARGATCRVGP
jgi:hypothetical protein